jgi:hypothetical protein
MEKQTSVVDEIVIRNGGIENMKYLLEVVSWRWLRRIIFLTSITLLGAGPEGIGQTPPPKAETFYKDVLPILQQHCQTCHRPGNIGPMPLRTYEETRPWATAIKMAVLSKKMPPWFADSRYGHWANSPTLSPEEVRTIVKWADRGAIEGEKRDSPPPKKFVDGWDLIRDPDLVLEMPEYHIPAEGALDYLWVVIPTGLTHDVWVQQAQVLPSNRSVVHHSIAYIRPPGSQFMKELLPGVVTVPGWEKAGNRLIEGLFLGVTALGGFAPGLPPRDMKDGAILVKAGSDIVLQLHYTPNGTATVDKSKIGLIFSRTPPTRQYITVIASNPKFEIPPNDDNYEVTSEVEFKDTVTLIDLFPHMHLRGKDFLYRVVYPSGESQILLSVPNYNFYWQLSYELAEPLVLPKGTRVQCVAHFDNSINNPYNPDAGKAVRYGDQTWDEMMNGNFTIRVDPDKNVLGLIKNWPGTARSTVAQSKAVP